MGLYLATAARTFVVLLVLAGSVNVVVDPGEQLLRANVDATWFERQAAALAGSPHGMPYGGAGRERGLKRALASRYADCHVIGSSRASQLSSVREGAIRARCPALVNLWVPGASLEDVTVLAGGFLASGTPLLVLALDPWMLGFDATAGWRNWSGLYADARRRFGLSADPAPRAPARDRLLAAFSLPAFFASLSLLTQHAMDLDALWHPSLPRPLDPFDLHDGHVRDATLADGSRVYARKVLADARRGRMERLRPEDVPRASSIDPAAVAQLDVLLARLRAEGRTVALLRVPFHPEVFARSPERVAAYLAPAEARLDALAARHGLARFGSYRPEQVGCGPREFKDLRHPLPECLDRIDWQRTPELRTPGRPTGTDTRVSEVREAGLSSVWESSELGARPRRRR